MRSGELANRLSVGSKAFLSLTVVTLDALDILRAESGLRLGRPLRGLPLSFRRRGRIGDNLKLIDNNGHWSISLPRHIHAGAETAPRSEACPGT